ncbi:polyprenyl synthetase family protein [Streptomyces massasporeus]|uniref:Polyprenyl synthetase family protein n=1 Tax=Streptomyces massasporeus TaxID=67324 RepID=A0ABW6LDH6_9ACTN
MIYDSHWSDIRSEIRLALARHLNEIGLPCDIVSRLSHRGRLNRASLFLILADPGDTKENRESIVTLAVGLEMIHKASVIRDDVEDRDILRRGLPTELSLMGPAGALALSDVLLAHGLATIFRVKPTAMHQILNTLASMSSGQFHDVHSGIAISDPFDVAERKTGSLLALVFWMGALCSSRSREDRRLLHSIGLQLGTAFQLVNDINNVTRDEGRGKDIRSDLAERRNSSIALLMSRQGAGTDEAPTETDISAAVDQARAEVARRLDEAKALASQLDEPLPVRLHLLINDEATARDFVNDQQALI